MSNRYFIFTDEAKVLGVMNGGSTSDASGMAGTYYDSRYTVTILNTEVPDGAPSDYTLKAAAVEACQTSIAVHPTDDAVQRAIANALTGGSSFTTAEMAPRVGQIAPGNHLQQLRLGCGHSQSRRQLRRLQGQYRRRDSQDARQPTSHRGPGERLQRPVDAT